MLKKLVLTAALFIYSTTIIAAEQFFKYVDNEGNTIISNNLPAEYANDGYAIVTSRGNVIQVVHPKKTEAQLAKELAREKQLFEQKMLLEAKEKEKLEQARKDDILLKTFATEKAIIRNRDDKIDSIAVLESITKENIIRLKNQLKQAQKTAAQYERSGKLIPLTVNKTIDDSKRQINENLDFLMKKAKEKEQLKIKYETMIERFRTLHQN
jgi:hypothetical protein